MPKGPKVAGLIPGQGTYKRQLIDDVSLTPLLPFCLKSKMFSGEENKSGVGGGGSMRFLLNFNI